MHPFNKTENLIVEKSFEFAISIIEYCEELVSQKKFILSNQLLKSGTSIGANVWEAQNAESKPDFIHKFKIAAKEVDETKYWIQLCKHSKNYPNLGKLTEEITSISKIINSIFATSKNNSEESSS